MARRKQVSENGRAALYIRVSTNYQIDKDSLPLQRKDLTNYAKLVLNITDVVVFEDAGYSGKNTARPAYQRMMSQIRNHEFTHLLVWKIDRISRNVLDFAGMYEELKKYGCTFVSKNEQFDTSSAMGEAMLKIILIFAELERKMTSERVKAVMNDRAVKGLWNGARMPLGYRWDDESKYPVIDDEEALTIKYIYDMYEKAPSSTKISRLLNNNNVKTKRGGEWTSKTISDIIRSPFYKGTYRYNYRESARGEKKPESEWIVVDNNHPAIIDVEQWDRCNKIMNKNTEMRNPSQRTGRWRVHIFAGLIKCAECGYNYSAFADKPRLSGWQPSTYHCSWKLRMADCQGKGTSDVVLGPFLINYIANMVRVEKYFKRITSPELLEKELLEGSMFECVEGIEDKGIQDTFNAIMYKSYNCIKYKPRIKPCESTRKDETPIDLDILKSEHSKVSAALSRLLDLYLYNPESMTKKDYIVKKMELESRLSQINETIDARQKQLMVMNSPDISFIKKASAFILSKKLTDYYEIDYNELAENCDKEVLKELFNDVLESVTVRNGLPEVITFKNGLTHKIIYKQ